MDCIRQFVRIALLSMSDCDLLKLGNEFVRVNDTLLGQFDNKRAKRGNQREYKSVTGNFLASLSLLHLLFPLATLKVSWQSINHWPESS